MKVVEVLQALAQILQADAGDQPIAAVSLLPGVDDATDIGRALLGLGRVPVLDRQDREIVGSRIAGDLRLPDVVGEEEEALLFGTIEMGLLFKDSLTLNSACREAARVAAVGAVTTDVTTRARAAATTLVSANVTVTQQYRVLTSGVWGAWTTLADSGGYNTAPSGSQVRITVSYPHSLVTGSLFASLANPGTSTVTMRGSMVMMRE